MNEMKITLGEYRGHLVVSLCVTHDSVPV